MFNDSINARRKGNYLQYNNSKELVCPDDVKSGNERYFLQQTKEKRKSRFKMADLWYEIAYRELFLFIFLVSLLPMKILYAISSFTYIFVYHLFSYRKAVVIQNFSRSFPNKKYSEIECFVKEFYRSFTDHFAEIIKTISISREKQSEKVKVINPEIISALISQDKNVFALIGHCGNWEMLNILPYILQTDTFGLSQPS